jgi:hypothetical protein
LPGESVVTNQDLIELANRYAQHRGLTLSTVATYAGNDGKLFNRLSKGGGVTLRTASALISWFATNWPADLDWPDGIQRPRQVSGRAA